MSKTALAISVIVVAMVFIGLNISALSYASSFLIQSIYPKPFFIPLVPYSDYNLQKSSLDEYASTQVGVPNYDQSIYLSYGTRSVEMGNKLQVRVVINDTGNIKLKRPYFYVFISNNEGKVVSVFPKSVWVSTYSKIDSWDKNAPSDTLSFTFDAHTYLVPRHTLINGHGDYWDGNNHVADSQIWLEMEVPINPRRAGEWNLYVIVFDEKYYNSEGTEIQSSNATTYVKDTFLVIPQSIPVTTQEGISWDVVSFIASLLVTSFSAFAMIKKIAPWIDSKWKNADETVKRNRVLLIFLCVIVFLYIILWLFRP